MSKTAEELTNELTAAKVMIGKLVESLLEARNHCGWAQTQVDARNARNCAFEAAKVLEKALTEYEAYCVEEKE